MEILLSLLRTDGDWAVTAARIILGLIMFAHGAQKLLGWYGGHGFEHTMQVLTTYLKLPRAVAVLVILTEFLGGLGLMAGFLSRLAAVGILAAMLGAVIMVHYAYGLFMNWAGEQKGNGFEYHLLAIALALVVIIKGGGALSVDHVLYEHQVDNRAALMQTR
jgi:putative oxidoreductase